MASIYAKGRDNARTPIQWDDSENGGFTAGEPWIAVNPNYREINVEESLRDPDSIFHYYKTLIALRKRHPIMIYGSYDIVAEEHEQIYAYTRSLGEQKWLVVLNFSGKEAQFVLPEALKSFSGGGNELIIANYGDVPAASVEELRLRPYEARVYKLV